MNAFAATFDSAKAGSSMTKAIRNIWCVGRNYGAHAKELGNAVPAVQSAPLIFLKSGSCIVENGSCIELPALSRDIQHEVEIAFRFGPDLKLDHISLALDLTARDLQTQLRQNQQPWTLAKSFRQACPLGPLVPWDETRDTDHLSFWLSVNGEVRQKGHSSDMIHSVKRLRTYVLENFPVMEGDLLLTGTPAGVGPIQSGDRLTARLEIQQEAHIENGATTLLEAGWTVA